MINFINAKAAQIQCHQQAQHNYVIGRKIELFKHKKDIFSENSPKISQSSSTKKKKNVTCIIDTFFLLVFMRHCKFLNLFNFGTWIKFLLQCHLCIVKRKIIFIKIFVWIMICLANIRTVGKTCLKLEILHLSICK